MLKISFYGMSHSPVIGVKCENLPKGFKIDLDEFENALTRRSAKGKMGATSRQEKDYPFFVSGIDQGVLTGELLHICFKNSDVKKEDYTLNIPRPSHSDLVSFIKYGKIFSGGLSSGRLTLPMVALGEIVRQILKSKGVEIYSHILRVGTLSESRFAQDEQGEKLKLLKCKTFQTMTLLREDIESEISKMIEDGDSIGGVVEVLARNVPKALGGVYQGSAKSEIAKTIFQIPGILGLEFGDGFEGAKKLGSQRSDQLEMKKGEIRYLSNNDGGIQGGFTNGEDILFTVAVKPTPTISKPMKSVDLENHKNVLLESGGRHDVSIVLRFPVIAESMTAIAIYNLMEENK